jgi:hypothetical protein
MNLSPAKSNILVSITFLISMVQILQNYVCFYYVNSMSM